MASSNKKNIGLLEFLNPLESKNLEDGLDEEAAIYENRNARAEEKLKEYEDLDQNPYSEPTDALTTLKSALSGYSPYLLDPKYSNIHKSQNEAYNEIVPNGQYFNLPSVQDESTQDKLKKREDHIRNLMEEKAKVVRFNKLVKALSRKE